eukprot:s26_g75.t1
MFNKETMNVIMQKMIKEEDKDTITLKQEDDSADLGREDDDDLEDGIIHLRNDDGEMISPELAALFKEFFRQQREKEKKRKEEEKDPVVPSPEHINQYLEGKEKKAAERHGSSSQQEEPAAPASSSEKEATSAQKWLGKEAPELFYGSNISGCEEDSVLRLLRGCFPDTEWEQWCGFYNRGYPQSEKHKHMFWHTQYRPQDLDFTENHAEHWHQPDEHEVMDAYIARHKDMDVEAELEEYRNSISFDCSDPRLQLRRRAQVEKLTEKAERRLHEDWERMDKIMADYIQ